VHSRKTAKFYIINESEVISSAMDHAKSVFKYGVDSRQRFSMWFQQ